MDPVLQENIRMYVQSINIKRYLKRYEAEKYLSVGKTKFKRMLEEGIIKPILLDGMKRYDKKDLDELMDSGRV